MTLPPGATGSGESTLVTNKSATELAVDEFVALSLPAYISPPPLAVPVLLMASAVIWPTVPLIVTEG